MRNVGALLLLIALFALNPACASERYSTVLVEKTSLSKAERQQLELYLVDLDRRLRRHWFPPRDGGVVTERFKIRADGSLEFVKLFGPSTCWSCEKAAADAVRNSAPFRALPAGCPAIDVVFHFDYRIFSPVDEHFKILTLGAEQSGRYLIPSDCNSATSEDPDKDRRGTESNPGKR